MLGHFQQLEFFLANAGFADEIHQGNTQTHLPGLLY